MSRYCFRIRFQLGSRTTISSPATELVLSEHEVDGEDVTLRSSPRGPLSEATRLAAVGRSYGSEDAAIEAGFRWRGILAKGFARVNIGADFGDRTARGVVTTHGRRMLEEESGERVLNDVHGLMVFECDPWPRFASVSGELSVGRSVDHLMAAIAMAARRGIAMSERDRLAYDFYSASFSQPSADARFVMLMMALETLMDPRVRSPEEIAHVDTLIAQTLAAGLKPNEVASIVGSLEWLRSESISQAGRRLARQLGDRRYLDETPTKFFTRCYELRSRLVHGAFPAPSWGDINQRAGALELFVSDLLSIELLDAHPGGTPDGGSSPASCA